MQLFTKTKYMTIPSLGFGTWQLNGEQCTDAVKTALDIGYRHIDTAQIYENEAEVGKALVASPVQREAIFLTTKIWTSNFKKNDVKSSFEESLKKLQSDYVDLLLIHWPNPEVELKETLDAFAALKESGQVKNIGVSNFPVSLMKQAIEELGFPIACNQVEYHALLNQQPVLDYAHTHDMIVTAYSPLARGGLNENDVLLSLGKKYNKTPSQIALRWLIEQKNVCAIPKASSEAHIRANFEIFDFQLEEDDSMFIGSLNSNYRTVNPDFAPQWDVAA